MNPVIGLFRREVDIDLVLNGLKKGGFTEDNVSILNQENTIRKLLGCEPTCVVPRYAAWGASIGIAIYGIFGLAAGWCQCNLLGFGHTYGTVALVGGLLAGAFIGGFISCFLGVAELEKESYPYIQGIRMGDRVIVVQAEEAETERAWDILSQEDARKVKVITH